MWLKGNILNFWYGINYEYEEMLPHSFDIFYVVTKFNLLTIEDINISPINFDMEYSYLVVQLDTNPLAVKHLPYIRIKKNIHILL